MAATARSPPSRIRTATAGCSRRSLRDCPDASTRRARHSPPRLISWPRSNAQRRRMASTRSGPASTMRTGPTGTPTTSSGSRPASPCPHERRLRRHRRSGHANFEQANMESSDDDLTNFEANGAAPLPVTNEHGHVDHDGARIWYAAYGAGSPVILLHGGLGHGGNWGFQVPKLVSTGHRPELIDSRGHGRSTRDVRPFTYELMASDVLAVMDALGIEKAPIVGWSDGACTALVLARNAPARVAGVFFFACNMDPSGTKTIEPSLVLGRCFRRHAKDYAELSATPDQFEAFAAAVGRMQKSEPNYSTRDLADIQVPIAIVQSEHDEFIKPEHAEYLARSIPGAELILLRGVSHFAPLQRPDQFNGVLREFLGKTYGLDVTTG